MLLIDVQPKSISQLLVTGLGYHYYIIDSIALAQIRIRV